MYWQLFFLWQYVWFDDINGHHVREQGYPSRYTHQIKGMYITGSIVIIEKDEVKKPYAEVTGTKQIY